MRSFLFELTGNIMTALLFCYFASSVLKNKNIAASIVVGILLLGIIGPAGCSFLAGPVSFAVSIILFFVYLCLFFKGTIKEKLIAYCLGYVAINLAMIIVSSFFGVIRLDVEFNSVIYICFVGLLAASLLFMISRTWNSIAFVISNVRFITFFMLPISQFAMVVLVVLFMSKMTENNMFEVTITNQIAAILSLSVLIISLIADGFFIQSFARMATDIKERERLQALEMESEMTYDYVKNMENDITRMRHYRHDFINLLTTVQLAIGSDDERGKEEALNIIRQMTNEIHEISGGQYCESNLINCILTHEKSKLEKYGVSCDFRAEIGEELYVSEVDLCRLLTNLIDNAGESCRQVEENRAREVRFNMRVNDGYLYVTVRNTRPTGKLELQSAKSDKELHGLGLSIIREIVCRYDGELIINDENDAVTVTATLAWRG